MARPLGEATREAYGKALAELGRENPNIVVLDGDLSKSTMTKYFAQEFPGRFFNVGIAEANMVGVAAGLAAAAADGDRLLDDGLGVGPRRVRRGRAAAGGRGRARPAA